MEKLWAKWVLSLLTLDQKTVSTDNLAMNKLNSSEFLSRFITVDVDETWIHYYTPESQQQSKQWTVLGEPTPKGVIFISYLQKGRTTQTHLSDEIKGRGLHLEKKKILVSL